MNVIGHVGPGLTIGDFNGDGNIDVVPMLNLGAVVVWGLGGLLNRQNQVQQQQHQDGNEYHTDGYYDQYRRWHPYRQWPTHKRRIIKQSFS